jgi:hypothetical protein
MSTEIFVLVNEGRKELEGREGLDAVSPTLRYTVSALDNVTIRAKLAETMSGTAGAKRADRRPPKAST